MSATRRGKARVCHAINGDGPQVAAVQRPLLASRRPTAVSWSVMAVRVNSIDRVALRAWAHVLKEGLETSPVSYTHLTLPTNREV